MGPCGLYGPHRQATYVQIALAPVSDLAAVIVRQDGQQGIYRAQRSEDGVSKLEPWIVLPGIAMREVSWSPDGRHLLFTADHDNTSNVYCHDIELNRITQLTDVAFGAFDPQVSPNGRTLAFVEYQHEQYDLVSIPFAPERAPEVTLPHTQQASPLAPLGEIQKILRLSRIPCMVDGSLVWVYH